MRKLEIAGDARTLNEGIKTLNELDCTIEVPKTIEIVPIRVDDKKGFAIIGKHHLSTPQGISSSVEMSLLLGANGTVEDLSEHVGPASSDTRYKVLNALRRYSLHCLQSNVSSQSDVVLGLSHNGKGTNELLYVVKNK
ncbi:MAG: hypothetical protein ACFFB3_24270 [Candidatus Hodarchaeota archaeon]